MFWLGLPRATDLFDGHKKRILHVGPIGPEHMTSRLLQRLTFLEYVSADLDPRRATEVMDIRCINYPANLFDAILCSHVLEHVDDGRKAIAELFRVLKPGGWAILQVPITVGQTEEDSSISDPHEHARRFGQFDHVRRYGKDYKSRLEQAGFDVEMLPCLEIFSGEELNRCELMADEDQGIWFVRKPTEISAFSISET
jgi:SAM-dependent methyltransferase